MDLLGHGHPASSAQLTIQRANVAGQRMNTRDRSSLTEKRDRQATATQQAAAMTGAQDVGPELSHFTGKGLSLRKSLDVNSADCSFSYVIFATLVIKIARRQTDDDRCDRNLEPPPGGRRVASDQDCYSC